MAADAVSKLVDSLRADGAFDSEGHFTLDREQARTKMQKFQLSDARRYVLELVQAAMLRGAEKIKFDIDTDDMHMRFGGQVFSEAEIDDLYGSLFRPGDDRALRGVRQLAIGLNAAMGMDLQHIHLRSGNVELRMQPGHRDELIKHDVAQPETTIHVKKHLRTGMLLEFFANLTGRMAEEKYLRERCAYAGVPIYLDGDIISRGFDAAADGPAVIRFEEPGFAGLMRFEPSNGQTVLHLIKDGVWIDSRPLPQCGLEIVAWVEGERLRKDVSQAKIVADEAVEAIVAAVQRMRWKLWRSLVEKAQPWTMTGLYMQHVRRQLLEYVEFDELRNNEDALVLAEKVTWKDCRGEHPPISLRQMVELVVAGETPRFASSEFPHSPVEAPPVLWMKKKDAAILAKALGTAPVQANDLLARAELRAIGYKAWLEREGDPVLPTHVQFQYRAAIREGEVRGQVGIDHNALFGQLQHPVQVLLYKQHRLLGRLEVDANIPDVWLVIEAEFNPTDDYRDVVRDQVFVRSILAGFAALIEPLGRLLADHVNDDRSANVRGLVKRWLIALVDQQSQAALLSKADVDVAPKFHKPLAELLPGLTSAGLLGPEPPLLARQPLFAQVQGPHRSLVELAEDVRKNGHVLYLATPPEDPRFEAPGVVVLGPGDRKLVRGLFGDESCREFDATPQQRRLSWLAQPNVSGAALREQLERQLSTTGVQASRWVVELSGAACGFVIPAYGDLGHRFEDLRPELLGRARVRVLVEQRWLCEVEEDVGFGPLIAVVEADALRPNATYESVERDGAWKTVLADLHAAVDRLAVSLCGVFEQEVPSVQRWLARVLLHAAARGAAKGDRTLFDRMAQLPTLDTVSGRVLSLAQAEHMLGKAGKLEIVPRETSWAPITDPEIIKAEPDERDDLAALFGEERVVDGKDRVRYRHLSEQLAARPTMTETQFEPEQVLVSIEIKADGGRRGVVGVSRTRSELSLQLRLGAAGHHLQDVFDLDDVYSVPVDAIVIDDQLPLGADGMPDFRSKRYNQIVRQVRGRISNLVGELCRAWTGDEQLRPQLWPRLLGYLQREKVEDVRRRDRQQAFDAASKIAGFVDLWGKPHSLHDILAASPQKSVRALMNRSGREIPEPLSGELILQLEPAEYACLSAHLEVVVLDEQWEAELERLRWLAAAPMIERPDIDEIALAYRKATVGGGLECELWLPRDHSPLAREQRPEIDFVREGRRIGRAALLDLCPCAGIVSGAGLVANGREIVLDKRQRSSLLRQVLILYVDLAHALGNRKLSGKDNERALAYLAWVDHQFEVEAEGLAEVFSVGKHGAELRSLVAKLVPPTLRATMRQRAAPPREPAAVTTVAPAPVPAPAPAPAPTPAPTPTASTEPQRALTPGERLLVAIEEQLRWARARHGNLLDELRLTHLQLQPGNGKSIVQIKPAGIVLDSAHPLIQRLLEQHKHDRFDLAFALAAVYTQMNHVAEQITDDDEREFVAQLAQTLSLSLQAAPHANPT